MYLQRSKPLKTNERKEEASASNVPFVSPFLRCFAPIGNKQAQAVALWRWNLVYGQFIIEEWVKYSIAEVWEGLCFKVTPPLGSHSVVGWDVDGVGGRVVLDSQTQICDGRCAVLLHQDVFGLEVSVSNGGFSWMEGGGCIMCLAEMKHPSPGVTTCPHEEGSYPVCR